MKAEDLKKKIEKSKSIKFIIINPVDAAKLYDSEDFDYKNGRGVFAGIPVYKHGAVQRGSAIIINHKN